MHRLLCLALSLLVSPVWALSPQELANVEVVQSKFRLMFEVRSSTAAAALLVDDRVSKQRPPETRAQMPVTPPSCSLSCTASETASWSSTGTPSPTCHEAPHPHARH